MLQGHSGCILGPRNPLARSENLVKWKKMSDNQDKFHNLLRDEFGKTGNEAKEMSEVEAGVLKVMEANVWGGEDADRIHKCAASRPVPTRSPPRRSASGTNRSAENRSRRRSPTPIAAIDK